MVFQCVRAGMQLSGQIHCIFGIFFGAVVDEFFQPGKEWCHVLLVETSTCQFVKELGECDSLAIPLELPEGFELVELAFQLSVLV